MDPARSRLASNSVAIGIGLLLVAAIVAGTVTMRHRAKFTAPKIIIGTKDEVYYSPPATVDDATALGRALQNTGFFNNRGSTVLVSKNKGATVVSFVLDEGAWDRPGATTSFEEIGRRIATSIGGFPIQVDLVDTAWTVHKALTVGKVTLGARDTIYYLGSATEADARALGQALRDAGYLGDLGVTVVVAKGDGTVIGFVVGEGVWGRAEAAAGFEQLARRVAPSVGGLPVQLRLLSAQMETRRQTLLR